MSIEPATSVLFVCLGNICRSPTAHGVFRDLVAVHGLQDRIAIDSAGVGDWHIGKPPDRRAAMTAGARGIDISDLRARQVVSSELSAFDYVLAMDHANLDALETMAEAECPPETRIGLFGDYSPRYRGQAVPDPYFGGDDGFERVYDMIEACSRGLLETIQAGIDRGK